MGNNDNKSLSASIDSLMEWSLETSEVIEEISNRSFNDYIAWKLPAPSVYLTDETQNSAFRAFCCERMFAKVCSIYLLLEKQLNNHPDARVYCFLTHPNLFSSEVGITFSKTYWENLINRNVEVDGYQEKMEPTNCSVWDDFGISLPNWAYHHCLMHSIDDSVEEISYRGRLHAIWIENLNVSPVTYSQEAR